MNETLPQKILQEITLACLQLEQCYFASDMAQVVLTEMRVKSFGYELPDWLMLMIKWKEEDPVLNAEEKFRKRYSIKKAIPVLLWDETTGKPYLNPDHRPLEALRHLPPKNKPRFSNEELLHIREIIRELNDSVRRPGFEQALWGLSAKILTDDCGGEHGLNFEFHCKATETQSLNDQHNRMVLKKMLRRESQFWQNEVTLSRSITTGHVKPSNHKAV